MQVVRSFHPQEFDERSLAGVRIALSSGAYNHIADGVSLTLNRLVGHLERRGAEVLVFAPTVAEPPIRHEGTLDPLRSLPMPGRAEYRVAWRLSRQQIERLRTFDPDLVHVATPDLAGTHLARLARSMNKPLVTSYHTHFASYLSYYRLEWLAPLLWNRLRGFHARCTHTYVPTPTIGQILEEHGISEGIRLWPRGVETDRFAPRHRDMAWRRSLGFADDDVVVAFVSRLVLEKGLGVFAETMDLLKARGVRFRSLIVGEGPARADLQKQLPDTVFTGHLGGRALARAYASADVFLFPSETETFGNVTLEAMASGLPAVCADAPGSDALVVPGRTGFLAPSRNAQVMAAHVERLVCDDDLRQRMGLEARAEALSYAWPAVLDRMVGYYADVLGLDRAPVEADRTESLAAAS